MKKGHKQKSQSFYALAFRRFKKNKLALWGVFVLLSLIASAIFAPLIAPYDPYMSVRNDKGMLDILSPPSSAHFLGTDSVGRDVASRLIYAGRVSLSVGVVAVSISIVIGTVLGSLAGFFGRWVDSVIMRGVDVVICFPVLFLIITISTLLKPSIYTTMIVIGLVSWTNTARLVRGEILKVREFEFVESSRALGARNGRIIFRHILPNIMAPIVVQATLQTAQAILIEASLSFLGVGVQQPIPSWGNMLNEAMSLTILAFKPMIWFSPGIAIVITVLSINFIGDGLRDALDPKLGNN
ncbi:MAG: ABC transporter permease [Desulfobacteraceae bacterium]|nr:ABC transporter permease [Desulfobacteraceae bacterium]